MKKEEDCLPVLIVNSVKKLVEANQFSEAAKLLQDDNIIESLKESDYYDYRDDFMYGPVSILWERVDRYEPDNIVKYNILVSDYQDMKYICETFLLSGSLSALKDVYDKLLSKRKELVRSIMVPDTTILYRTLVENNLPF